MLIRRPRVLVCYSGQPMLLLLSHFCVYGFAMSSKVGWRLHAMGVVLMAQMSLTLGGVLGPLSWEPILPSLILPRYPSRVLIWRKYAALAAACAAWRIAVW